METPEKEAIDRITKQIGVLGLSISKLADDMDKLLEVIQEYYVCLLVIKRDEKNDKIG
jgi:hypothetical protein